MVLDCCSRWVNTIIIGCGKTLTAIAIMSALFRKGKIKRVLIIAPASVCSVWEQDLGTFAAFPYEVAILLGTKPKRLKALGLLTKVKDKLQVAVINYESTWRDGISQAIDDFDPDLVICDESQRIKSHDSKQSIRIHELGDVARFKLILSGTPLQNHVSDIYSQYRFMNPDIFGTNYYAFRGRYCIMGGFDRKQIVGTKNEDELTEKMYSSAYRVTKADALDLPEQIFRDIILDFDPKERADYRTLNSDSIAELEEGEVKATTVLTKLLRLQQFTGGFLCADGSDKVECVSKAKLNAMDDILEDYVIGEDKKLVVFARFREEIKQIEKLVQSKKIGYSMIYGDIPLEDRGDIAKDFQENPETKVIICQIQCAGLGITLTAADTCVYYSMDFNYANYEQASARIHRIGQKNACTYLRLIVKGTVDEKVLKAIESKGDLAKSVVDNWRQLFIEET